jgi:hypothetical protein
VCAWWGWYFIQGIDRPWRRRERRMEQHREHLLAAETKRLQADLEFQLQDALLVCDVLTPVLRQMTREASKVCTDNQSVIMLCHDSDAD